MPIERIQPRFLFNEERIEQLKQIAPECFADGKINWEVLKEAIGNYTEEEGADAEHFGLFWPGKREARKLAGTPPKGTLVPVPGEGVDEENTRNIFIEGENLEVLKLLQKSYAGRIKMIYIDPPYNTGNDFVYDDNFTETIEDYLKRTGQIDEEGRKLTTNTRSDGRFHSKWLSMMYPRLRLARNLLGEDGAIFISIDDNEVHNIRQLMNEVFGEENFIGQLVWKKKYIGGKHARHFVDLHEYIIVFAKNTLILDEFFMERPEAELEKFDLEDEYIKERGRHYIRPLKSNLGRRATLIYPIEMPDGSTIETQWMVARDTLEKLKKEGRILFKQKKDGTYNIYRKYYEYDNGGSVKVPSLIDDVSNADGKVEIKELFDVKEGREIPFDNPKPTGLLKYLIKPLLKSNEIVLDFFAGSNTTAHAVLDLNNEDGGNRCFITVQIPEIVNPESEAFKLGYNKISQVSAERIRKVINRQQKGNSESKSGFLFYRLQKSQFKNWISITEEDKSKLELAFDDFSTPLIESWNQENLLSELLLLEGFPLDSKISIAPSIKGNNVKIVKCDFHEHRLIFCLDKEVFDETIKGLQLLDNDIFICLDSAISDQQKVVLSDKGLIKTI